MAYRLNEGHPDSAYHCGRLMAVCQHIQDVADRHVGSTFVNRYYSGASQSPATVIPGLWKVARHRLRQVPSRRMRADLEALVTRVHNEIKDRMPLRLNLDRQGVFQLGFFHQKAVVPRFDSRLRYMTRDGKAVQSDGERFIWDLLSEQGESFKYEEPLPAPEKPGQSPNMMMHPDFTLSYNGCSLYIEFLGVRRDPDYRITWSKKRRSYVFGLGCKTLEEMEMEQKVGPHTLMEVRPEDLYERTRFVSRLGQGIRAWRDAINGGVSPF
jgi:hypothetical protein